MKPKICLNMIVKNASHAIQKCLESVKPMIDTWVIVDMGSTDDTKSIIQDVLKEIPGVLHNRPYVNFGHNRNEALALAKDKADYILFFDADERLIVPQDYTLPALDRDYYTVAQHDVKNKTDSPTLFLAKNSMAFKWQGAVYESPVLTSKNVEMLKNIVCEKEKDPEDLKNDLRELKIAHQGDPTNPRHVFYLGLTYQALGNNEAALQFFEKRASMDGDKDEKYYALYSIGLVQKALNTDSDTFVKSLSKAYRFRTSRVEAIYALADYFIGVENYLLGYLVSKCALTTSAPQELLVSSWMYDWGIMYQYVFCAIKIGRGGEAKDASNKLLANPRLPLEKQAAVIHCQPLFPAKTV